MKKSGSIILSVFLSLMVVYLVGGVAVVYCCHSEVSGVPVSMEGEDCADGCPVKSSCMSVEVIRLMPCTKPVVHDFSLVPSAACSIREWYLSDFYRVPVLQEALCRKIEPKAPLPPRAYLSFINILLI